MSSYTYDNGPLTPQQPTHCMPHQCGWLRRPELDQDSWEVWEKPDGTLYRHASRGGPLIVAVLLPSRASWRNKGGIR